jgi:DNA helicase-2/ATP-dependent DNA helicase PcrA
MTGTGPAPTCEGSRDPLGAVEIARLLRQPHLPTPEQVRVIEAPAEPLLVVAGAGSGKTETMAARVVWLVANGVVRPDEVLGLTFTRKAAGELADRIGARLRALRRALGEGRPGAGEDRPRIATYNAYAGAIVRDHGLRVGLDPDARLLTEAGRWQLAHRVVEGWPEDLDLECASRTVTQAVLRLSGALAEHLLSPAEAGAELRAMADALVTKVPAPRGPSRTLPRKTVADVAASLRARADLMALVEEFARCKRERSVLDFADQVALACRIATAVPRVAEGERAQYRVVLLDEYQDTSVAQVRLLAALFGHGHPVTAVGDPHQAIYGWRGASAGAIDRFPTDFPRVGEGGRREPARTATLATSWRNDVAVLAAANRVAGPLRTRAAAPGRAPAAAAAPVPLPVLASWPGAGPGAVRLVCAQTAADEARAVAAAIGAAWSPAGPTSRSPATAAVLCRARAQLGPMADALREAGLPVEVVGLGGLLGTPEIVDLHAALTVAHDPSRGDAALRLLTNLRLGIADLAVLHDHARRLGQGLSGGAVRRGSEGEAAGLGEALEHPPAPGWTGRAGRPMTPAGLARVRELGEVLRAVRAQTHLPLPELVAETERLLGLDIEVLARPGARPDHARRHLDAFAEVAAEFAEGSQAPTLGAFLAWLDAAEEYEHGLDTVDVDPDADAVQVLTVHASKGLEWDVVAVPGLAEGAFPHYDAAPDPRGTPTASAWLTSVAELPYPLRGDAADLPALDLDGPADHAEMDAEVKEFRRRAGAHGLAEERRLAYVALTRARRELILATSWWKEETARPRPPSRFVHELVAAGALTATEGDPAAPAPAEAANPLAARRTTASWPAEPGPERAAQVAQAVAAVRAAAPGSAEAGPRASATARAWARDAVLLLAERDRRGRPDADVGLPTHLSASSVVRLVADPVEFALDRRRPVPREPGVEARRGTGFHAWVERHFGSASLIDVEELAAADDEVVAVDAELARLQRAFLRSRWAGRTPLAVEADLETPVAGLTVRCRVDAVFATENGVEIVDWKTGDPPVGPAQEAARQMQLALYRLAWARLHRVPLESVRAAFYHVGHDRAIEAVPMTEAEIEATVAERLGAG